MSVTAPKHPSRKVDCVVIGFNDVGFGEFAEYRKQRAAHQGMYREILHNSVLVDGRRMSYMDLLSHVIGEATGKDPRLNVFEMPNLGVLYLASFLRRRGHHAEVINFFNRGKETLRAILADRPRTIAITTTYYVDPTPLMDVVAFVREHGHPETRIVVGGPHIYNTVFNNALKDDLLTQDFLLRRMGADVYIADSQGEGTLATLLGELRQSSPDLSRVPNLVYTEDGGETFERTAQQAESNSLDENAVDWDLFPDELVAPINYMRTARSCPFSCAFCNFPAFAGKHTLASLDVVEAELRQLHARGVRYMIFVDDTFNVPLPRFKELCRRMIRNRFDFQWVSFFRCSNADEEAFDLMAEAGCVATFLGVESGDQRVLDNMNKHATLEKYHRGILALNARGIGTHCAIIVGFPGETRETALNSLRFIEQTRPTSFNAHLYYHDALSPIHRRSEEFGIVGGDFAWRHDTMDWREAAELAEHITTAARSSVPLTNYGFDIWSFPYLMSKGIAYDRILEFAAIAREMLVAGFADRPLDFSEPMGRMVDLFRRPDTPREERARAIA